MPVLSSSEWEKFTSFFPTTHILQTRPWGDLKQAFGWKVEHLGIYHPDGTPGLGAQVLFRMLPLGISFAYIARGPVGLDRSGIGNSAWSQWLRELDRLCKKQRAIFLKIEPDLWLPSGESKKSEEQNIPSGFYFSEYDIQPARTLLVSLEGSETDILSRMKQKTRYNIRLAQKRGVVVHESEDLPTFYQLIRQTGQRDQFGVHNLNYYQKVFDLFYPLGTCKIFIAEYQQKPLAAVMVFMQGTRAWYFYGASSDDYRELMPAYLVQWEAMCWAREQGCTTYDLWGVPDKDLQSLEDNFLNNSSGLWGVYRFKRGFGGELKRTEGPWERVYIPFLYTLVQKWLKLRNDAG